MTVAVENQAKNKYENNIPDYFKPENYIVTKPTEWLEVTYQCIQIT